MVKAKVGSFFYKQNKPARWLVYLLIFSILGIYIATQINYTNNDNYKNKIKTNFSELPIDIFPHEKIGNQEYIVTKGQENKIYIYNVKNNSLKEVVKPNNSSKFIKALTGNSNWIVWFENESQIVNTENKPYNWDLVAQNLKTGERFIIDKSSFKSNKLEVPQFVNYTPSKISISNQDIIVYCKTVPDNDNKVFSELVAYDLKSKKNKIIAKSDSVLNELIDNFSIFENKVVWSKYSKLDQTYEKRLTQYAYSDLFIYDIVSEKSEQLTQNEFFDNPVLYKNYLAAVKVPEKEKDQAVCTSDVILMNLTDKKIKNIVNKDTVSFINNSSNLYYITIAINDKYLSWQPIGGGDNRYVYDYKNDKFIEVIKKNNKDELFYKQIYSVYGNDIFFHDIQGESYKNKNFLITIK